MQLSLNIYHTLALTAIVYYIGQTLKNRIEFFRTYCIPSPVIGGILFALATLGLNTMDILQIKLDTTLQPVFMLIFFCSVGYSARAAFLKKGGMQLLIIIATIAILCIIQDVIGVSVVKAFGLHPLLGTCIGSIPLVGGHGASAAFGPVMENLGAVGATTAAMAAATFGLVAGSMIGGPLARKLIINKKLVTPFDTKQSTEQMEADVSVKYALDSTRFMQATILLLLGVGLGSVITNFIAGKGITFSSVVGAIAAGCILRGFFDIRRTELPDQEMEVCGNITLHLFLTMAMMNLKLWELADLAMPMLIVLVLQTIVIAFFVYFVIFNTMGRDYEAAVMASGVCGFGLGATPNAIANMEAVVNRYGPAPRAFLLIPIVGSMFADIVNFAVLTFFMNMYG